MNRVVSVFLWGVIALAACGDDVGSSGGATGSASLSLLIEAEDTIIEGLEPGTEGASIQDGWAVSFDKYLVSIGEVELRRGGTTVSIDDAQVVDLVQVPSAGAAFATRSGISSGTWDLFYNTAYIAGAQRGTSVSEADFQEMRSGSLTYIVSGNISQTNGLSCPPPTVATPVAGAVSNGSNSGGDTCYNNESIAFRFAVDASTTFGPCSIDEQLGVTLTDGSTQTAALTIHGDHMFFNGFPEGDEGGVSRYAQWLADCDLNVDGTVTQDELAAVPFDQLSVIDSRYSLGGTPLQPLDTALTFVRAQLKTQGHFQGEGGCPNDGSASE